MCIRDRPSWEAVAEDPTIDAVSIVVGNALHRPIAEALIAAGKHVLCEKPLSDSLEDAQAMADAAAAHPDLVTGTAFVYRCQPAVAAIRDLVRSELGEVSHFNGRYWCDYALSPQTNSARSIRWLPMSASAPVPGPPLYRQAIGVWALRA